MLRVNLDDPASVMAQGPRRTSLSAPPEPIRMTLTGILTRLFNLRFTGQVTLHFLHGKVQFAEWGKPERYLIAEPEGMTTPPPADDDRS